MDTSVVIPDDRTDSSSHDVGRNHQLRGDEAVRPSVVRQSPLPEPLVIGWSNRCQWCGAKKTSTASRIEPLSEEFAHVVGDARHEPVHNCDVAMNTEDPLSLLL
jgi:hypothetical protein